MPITFYNKMIMGLSQKQLCEYFGWDYQSISQQAQAKGLSTQVYVQQKTGWILRQEVFYPPFNQSSRLKDHDYSTSYL